MDYYQSLDRDGSNGERMRLLIFKEMDSRLPGEIGPPREIRFASRRDFTGQAFHGASRGNDKKAGMTG